jgi:hypothetical protein
MIGFLTLLTVLFASPELVVQPQGDQLTFILEGADSLMERCINAGLELRTRFDLELCKTRSLWFDECKRPRTETRGVSFDPISQTFKLVKDRMDDGTPPATLHLSALEEVLSLAGRTDDLSVQFLSHDDPPFAESHRASIRFHAKAYCHGDGGMDSLLERLSFGLLQAERYDSGWRSIPLRGMLREQS